MAVQMSTSSAQDFMQMKLPKQGETAGGSTDSVDSSGTRREGFRDVLAALKKTTAESAVKKGARNTAEDGDAAVGENEESGKQIFSLVRETEALKAIADAMEENPEIPHQKELPVSENPKKSRFDPDAILGFATARENTLPELPDKEIEAMEETETGVISMSDLVQGAAVAAEADANHVDTEEKPQLDLAVKTQGQNASSEIQTTPEEIPAQGSLVTGETGADKMAEPGKTPIMAENALNSAVSAKADAKETIQMPSDGEVEDSLEALPTDKSTLPEAERDNGTTDPGEGKDPFEDFLLNRLEELRERREQNDERSPFHQQRQSQSAKRASSGRENGRSYEATAQTARDTSIESPKPNTFAGEIAAAVRDAELRPEFDSQAARSSAPGTSYFLDAEDAFGDGLTSVLEFMKNDDVSEARIVVEPPALGRIDVSLQARASGVEAIFKVDNEHLKQMLHQQLDILRTSLQAQGIHVSGLTVDIKYRDDQRGRGDAHDTNRKNRRVGGVRGAEAAEGEAEDMRLVRLDLEKGILNWVA